LQCSHQQHQQFAAHHTTHVDCCLQKHIGPQPYGHILQIAKVSHDLLLQQHYFSACQCIDVLPASRQLPNCPHQQITLQQCWECMVLLSLALALPGTVICCTLATGERATHPKT
jgi:hypothetical protein